ncbi:MAG: hypothetical protein ABW221_22505 [Vicinamibacteria bacterium]
MRESVRSGVLVAGLMAVALAAPAADRKYSDVQGTERVTVARPERPLSAITTQGGLTFYTDRTVFNTAHPGLPIENFSGTLVPANGVATCTGATLNAATNNECFAPGGIRPGISVVNSTGGDLVILTPPFIGVPCVSAGPNLFADASELQFTPPVAAVGLDFEANTPAAFTVTVFSPAGSLGTTTVTGAIPGVFWGVDTADPAGISRITFNVAGENGELFCNVAFGEPVPVELQSFTIQ